MKKKLEEEENERQRQKDEDERKKAIDKAASDAQQKMLVVEDEIFGDSRDDQDLVRLANNSENVKIDSVKVSQIQGSVSEAGFRARHTADQHIAWLEDRAAARLIIEPVTIIFNPELERIFGPGATRLAIEHQVSEATSQEVSVLVEAENLLNYRKIGMVVRIQGDESEAENIAHQVDDD